MFVPGKPFLDSLVICLCVRSGAFPRVEHLKGASRDKLSSLLRKFGEVVVTQNGLAYAKLCSEIGCVKKP